MNKPALLATCPPEEGPRTRGASPLFPPNRCLRCDGLTISERCCGTTAANQLRRAPRRATHTSAPRTKTSTLTSSRRQVFHDLQAVSHVLSQVGSSEPTTALKVRLSRHKTTSSRSAFRGRSRRSPATAWRPSLGFKIYVARRPSPLTLLFCCAGRVPV